MSNEIVTKNTNENNKKVKIGDIIFYSTLIFLFLFTFFTTTFWFSLVKIQQTSMLPTFQSGDILVLNKLSSYSRGDVIVFSHNENEDFIKRVIAVEGDTIYSINGEVYVEYYVNGELVTNKLTELYLNEQNSTYLEYSYGIGAVDIPKTTILENCVYVLGDNRVVSVDSRSIGQVKISSIKGVVNEFWIKNKQTTTKIFSFFENLFKSCKN